MVLAFLALITIEWRLLYCAACASNGDVQTKMLLKIGYGFMSTLLVLGMAWSRRIAQGTAMKILIVLGDASFAFYLIHQPVLAVASRLIRDNALASMLHPLLMFGVLFGLCLCTGLALHRWVERPMVGWFSPRPRTAQVIAS